MLKKSEISVILYNYHWMIQTIALKRSELGDAGERITAQYGIKASLPKPKGVHSDPIYFEVERRQKVHDNLRKIENKVMFIQENMHVIKNESEKIVLNKLLDGQSMRSISRSTGMTLSRVRTLKSNIVTRLYNNQTTTNDTNRTKNTVSTC